MQLILDNLSATIIGSVILMALVVINFRNQSAAVESTGNYALNRQMLDFTEVLQRDFQNVSSLETLVETDSTFSFFAQVEEDDTTKYHVAYERTQVGVREETPLYSLERFVDGVSTGSSMGVVTDWEIAALDANGAAAASTDDALQIAVRIRMITPFEVPGQNATSLTETDWEATFRPELLQDLSL
jgi:hypothetical protein